MRGMFIEDIWSRRDNGEPPPDQDEDPETYIRYTRLRPIDTSRYARLPKRPDGRDHRVKGR